MRQSLGLRQAFLPELDTAAFRQASSSPRPDDVVVPTPRNEEMRGSSGEFRDARRRVISADALDKLIARYTQKLTMCPLVPHPEAAPDSPARAKSLASSNKEQLLHRSVVLVGMRGAGKSTCGQALAKAVGR